jgi:hypothetical protein
VCAECVLCLYCVSCMTCRLTVWVSLSECSVLLAGVDDAAAPVATRRLQHARHRCRRYLLSPPSATQIHYSAREPNLSHISTIARVVCVSRACSRHVGKQGDIKLIDVDSAQLFAVLQVPAVPGMPAGPLYAHPMRSLHTTISCAHATHDTTRHDTTRHDTTRQHLTAPLRVGCRTNCRREVQHIAFSPVHPWLMFTGHASGSILVWSISAPKQGAQSRYVLLFFTYI